MTHLRSHWFICFYLELNVGYASFSCSCTVFKVMDWLLWPVAIQN
jgi:hypothetical protein